MIYSILKALLIVAGFVLVSVIKKYGNSKNSNSFYNKASKLMSFNSSESSKNNYSKDDELDDNNQDPEILDISSDNNSSTSDFSMKSKLNSAKKWHWIIICAVLIVVFAIAAVFGLAKFVTDCMWYSQLGFESVIWIQLASKVGVWALYTILMAAFGYLSASLAIRKRPDSSDGTRISIKGNVIEIKKGVSSKIAFHVAGIVSLIAGAIFGSQFYTHWAQILLMFHAQKFGIKDPQFGIDNGFYVFVLPGLRLFIKAFVLLLVFALIFSIATHLFMGAIHITMPIKGKGIFSITKKCSSSNSCLVYACYYFLHCFANNRYFWNSYFRWS